MAIDGEPKDGDFVRYIETLNRQADGIPGQVPARQGHWPGKSRRAAPSSTDSPRAAAPGTAAPASPSAPAPPTLAARSGQRRIALILTIAGGFALWHAIIRLSAALQREPVDLDDLIPAVFLAVCAFMLFMGGNRLRAAQKRQPLPSLPPLSTLPGKNRRA
ncbi:hypothetical protein GG851_14850 [Bordetella petrii]|nr:hypothetical protein [Bordetella petrii]